MEDYIFNETKYEIDFKDIYDICDFTLNKMKVENPILSIIIIDNEKIHEINKKYRSKDSETDVISFAFEDYEEKIDDNIRFLGEIYISYEKVLEQAKEYNHSEKRELCYLTVHGLLHLLGYDHMEEEDKKEMRALEEEILNEFNIKRG